MTDTLILGTLRKQDGLGVVHLEDVYATDIDDLWSAITTPDRVKRWIAEIQGDTTVGNWFPASFTSNWDGKLRVDVCEAPHHLRVSATDGETATIMEAWLTSEGDGTRLVVEERGLVLEDVAYHGSGWQTHLEDLKAVVENREPSNWEERWKELTPTYLAMPVEGP
jgi:uncharacterized protein YndB with AHSA1/START domain